MKAKKEERFKEMQEKIESLRKIALRQASRVIEKEVETNPRPILKSQKK